MAPEQSHLAQRPGREKKKHADTAAPHTLNNTKHSGVSLTHSLTNSLTHSLTRSLSQALTHSLTHPLTHSLTHSLSLTLTHSHPLSFTFTLAQHGVTRSTTECAVSPCTRVRSRVPKKKCVWFSVSVAQRGILVSFARCPFLVAGRYARVTTRDGARSSLRTYVQILFTYFIYIFYLHFPGLGLFYVRTFLLTLKLLWSMRKHHPSYSRGGEVFVHAFLSLAQRRHHARNLRPRQGLHFCSPWFGCSYVVLPSVTPSAPCRRALKVAMETVMS